MAIEEDIVEWINYGKRPTWQKAVFSRLCANESIRERDVTEIADSLIDETSKSKPLELQVEDIPGAAQRGGETVELLELSDVRAVNALLPDKKLTFSRNGLTIVYGDNGSGKSGYARLIRRAVTAKAPLDEVLNNVFTESNAEQAATYVYSIGDAQREWYLGSDRSRHLSSVRFYDEECGDSYINKASVVNYKPSALSLFDQLVELCDQVQAVLDGRMTELETQRPDLPVLPEGTYAHEFLRDLDAETTEEQLKRASELAETDRETLAQKLQEHARLRASAPSKEKMRLRQLRTHWTTIRAEMNALNDLTSSKAMEDLKAAKRAAQDKRDAANLASNQSFKDEPLPQVGSEAWRALWNAARDYSTSEAFHEHSYPHTAEGARCVLCQQPLSPTAAERLEKFERFVTDTTAREATQAEERLASWRDSLMKNRSLSTEATTAIAVLEASKEPVEDAITWLNHATSEVERGLEWLEEAAEGPVEPMKAPNFAAVGERIQQLRSDEEAVDEESFKNKLHELQADIDPLQARQDLANAQEPVRQEIKRRKRLNRIRQAQKQARTNAITRKRTELSSTYVTGHVQNMFIRECELLRLNKVTYGPVKGRKDVALEHQPVLKGAVAKAPVNKVLSEGEQTALGLAGFLTEVELDRSQSAVVLDDPVSSLDAQRRSRVADRLIQLAKSRQVIVFTHEATFVHMLNKGSEEAGVETTHRTVMRLGGQPGEIADRHPWKVQDVPQRLDNLTKDLSRMEKNLPTLDDDEYADEASKWGGKLSQLWERTVITDIAYRVVEGGTAELKPAQFKIISRVTAEDQNQFEAGYAKASLWASRHDQAPESNWQPPDLDEMQTELNRVRDWADRLKKYRSK